MDENLLNNDNLNSNIHNYFSIHTSNPQIIEINRHKDIPKSLF